MNKFEADVLIDETEVTLADQPVIQLLLKHPSGYQVDPSQLENQLLLTGHALKPPFTVIDQQIESRADQTSLEYTIKPQAIGDYLLSFGVVTFTNGNQTHSLIPEVLTMTVFQPKNLVLKPDGIIPLSRRPVAELDGTNKQRIANDAQMQTSSNREVLQQHTFPWHYIAGYCSLGILIFLLGKLALQYWQRSRPLPSPEDPRQTALQSLHSLTKEELGFDPFYTRLTQLLRRYFEEVHNIPATEMTSEEFLSVLSDNQTLSDTIRTQLKELLTHADHVKFALSASSEEHKAKALHLAQILVQEKE